MAEFWRNKDAKDGRYSRCKACMKRWYEEGGGREMRTQQAKRWAREHPGAVQARVDRWRKANPQRLRENSVRQFHTRRMRMMGNGPVERIDRWAIYERDEGLCHLCTEPCAREEFTLDHVVPVSRGGTHTANNVKVAHRSCNGRKAAKLMAELTA